jgi:plasmid stabilization system protein ParE
MTYRVVVLARARLDVDRLYDWIAEASPEGAQRWLDQFEKATNTLETNPFVAPLVPEAKSFDIEIRHILFRTKYGRTYRAIFTVVDDEIRILRIRGPGQSPIRPADIPIE